MAQLNEAAGRRFLREALDNQKPGTPLEVEITNVGQISLGTGSNAINVNIADGPNLDAFSRLRVSQNNILGNYQFLYNKLPLLFDEITGSLGANSSVFVKNRAEIEMNVTGSSVDRVVRQSKQYHRYQAGQSQFIVCTFGSGSQETGITKEVGYFDDDNGLFLRIDENNVSFVIRTNTSGTPTETVINQTDWNIDSLDGSGPSGLTLDISKTQILFIDYQWLGVGRVRFGFDIDGVIIYCHQVLNANTQNKVYMSTPALPIRYEIRNDGTGNASTFHQICSTVCREGADDDKGYLTTISNTDPTGNQISSQSPESILHIRLKQEFNRASAEIVSFVPSVFGSTNNWKFFAVLNAGFSNGSITGSWDSAAQALEKNEQNLIWDGTGYIIGSLNFRGGGNGTDIFSLNSVENSLRLLSNINGDSDILTIFAQEPAPGTEDASVQVVLLERF